MTDKEHKIIKLEKALRKYKRLSLHDDLTELFNRRKLEKDLKRYLELYKRYKIKFLVMMIDIDEFKQVNDLLGHTAGDRILKDVAKVLRKCVRKYEKVYRLSGDEFVIIFSHTRKVNVGMRRIRKNLAEIGVNVSIGMAKLSENVLEEVDKRMYEEKRRKI